MLYDLQRTYSDHMLFYWTNAAGDFNFPGFAPLQQVDINDVPRTAQEIFEKYWMETSGTYEYVATFEGMFGLAFGYIFDYGILEETGIVEEGKFSYLREDQKQKKAEFLHAAVKAAAEEMAVPFDHVLFGEDTDPTGDEILIFIPYENLINYKRDVKGDFYDEAGNFCFSPEQIGGTLNDLVEKKIKEKVDGMMKTFTVGFAVEGRYYVTVKALNAEDAKERAMNEVFDADFGDLEDIDSDPINAEDERGNLVDF